MIRRRFDCSRTWLITLWIAAASLACGIEQQVTAPIQVAGGHTPIIGTEPQHTFTMLEDDGTPRPAPDANSEAWRVHTNDGVRDALLLQWNHTTSRRVHLTGPATLRFSIRTPAPPPDDAFLSVTISPSDSAAAIRKAFRFEGTDTAWTSASIETAESPPIEILLEITPVTSTPPPWPVALATPEFVGPAVPQRPPSILLVSLDTLRADRIGPRSGSPSLTPALDRWAADRAVTFVQAVAAAPWTLPAHYSLFTAMDAVRHGVNHDVGGTRIAAAGGPVDDLLMMAEVLRREGYATAAFTGGAYVDHRFGFAQGFQQYDSWPDRSRDRDEFPTGVRNTLQFLRDHRDHPTFVFLHTYAVHDPYRLWDPSHDPDHATGGGRYALTTPPNTPENHFKQVNQLVYRPRRGGQRPVKPSDVERAVAMYDSGVRFADTQLGELLSDLAREGLDRDLVVVVTSDHGESLGDGERFGHVDLTDEVLMIPLMIAFADGRGAGTVIRDQVRQVDVWPTIADILGLQFSADWDGCSLLPLLDGGDWREGAEAWAYSSAANRGLGLRSEARWKYVLDTTAWTRSSQRQRLHDLTRDPSEMHPLAIPGDAGDIMRARSETYLEQRLSGLRLRITNRHPAAFQGTLSGPMIRPVGSKALNSDSPALEWVALGEASFDIPTGRAGSYCFEKVFGHKLRIEGAHDDTPFGHTIDVRDLADRPFTMHLDADGWKPGLGTASLATVESWWVGPYRAVDETGSSHDPHLIEQLRALGYVDDGSESGDR